MYEESCFKTLLLSFFYFSEQNSSIYNFILFKFIVETKLFEAWAYSLQTNFIFEFFYRYIRCYVQWKFEKTFQFLNLLKTLQFCSFINFQQNTRTSKPANIYIYIYIYETDH